MKLKVAPQDWHTIPLASGTMSVLLQNQQRVSCLVGIVPPLVEAVFENDIAGAGIKKNASVTFGIDSSVVSVV